MSRGFTGMRTGSFSHKSAKDQFLERMRGKEEVPQTKQEWFDKTMSDLTKEANKSTKYQLMMPGGGVTNSNRQLSKSAMEMLEKMALKKAKRASKSAAASVKIVAKNLCGMQGGKIDKTGRIYDKNNNCVATIDSKTGKVKGKGGTTICNYSNTSYCEYMIAQYVAKSQSAGFRTTETTNARGNSVTSVQQQVYGKDHDIWGHSPSPTSASNSIDTSWFWGNKDKDNTSWFWGKKE